MQIHIIKLKTSFNKKLHFRHFKFSTNFLLNNFSLHTQFLFLGKKLEIIVQPLQFTVPVVSTILQLLYIHFEAILTWVSFIRTDTPTHKIDRTLISIAVTLWNSYSNIQAFIMNNKVERNCPSIKTTYWTIKQKPCINF